MALRNPKRTLILAGLLLVVVVCTWFFIPPVGTGRQAEEERIREVLLRHQLAQRVGKGTICFLSVDGADPSPSLLGRIRDSYPMVMPASAGQFEVDKDLSKNEVIDKVSGQPAIIFGVGQIQWTTRIEVEVHGGYYCGPLCAAGYTYVLRKNIAGWAIASEVMNWIS